jgi:hypothetical protein
MLHDSKWNLALRNKIIQTFIDAISHFRTHDTLKYSWVRYIPVGQIAHSFWKEFQTELLQKLRHQELFYSDHPFSLFSFRHSKIPANLRILSDNFRDQDSAPLLPDLPLGDTAYVSHHYHAELDIPVMRKLGTKGLTADDFIERLRRDLSNDNAKMKKLDLEDTWHTRVATFLIKISGLGYTPKIKGLELIPLSDGRWVNASQMDMYLPTSFGVDIPRGLSISLVDRACLLNESRRKLFGILGVAEPMPEVIFRHIQQRYTGSVTPSHCYEDIKFLFWHNIRVPQDYPIHLMSEKGYRQSTYGGWMYRPNLENPFSFFTLLEGKVPKALNTQYPFLDKEYYNVLEACEKRNDLTGDQWLQTRCEIKETVQLKLRHRFATKDMSPELQYIVENLTRKLLSVLRVSWSQYCNEWDSKIRQTKIPILYSSELRALENTFIPLPKLKSSVIDLNLQNDFGFLKEMDGMIGIDVAKWSFLERFGVGIQEDVSFWLAVLYQARKKGEVEPEIVFKIYSRLQTYAEPKDKQILK